LPEQGRNFGNKIWNAFRLISQWEVDSSIPQPEHSKIAVEWLDSIINKALEKIEDDFSKYRISEALMEVYKLFWDEFSAWYLEIIKPAYQQPIDVLTHQKTIEFFEKLLKMLHPFMPFITEEIWHFLATRNDGESIMVTEMPAGKPYNSRLINDLEQIKDLASKIRTTRTEKNIPVRDSIELFVKPNSDDPLFYLNAVITKLCNVSSVSETNSEIDNSSTFLVKTIEYFIPLSSTINVADELKKLNQEKDYLLGFLRSVEGKLSNEKFMANAPENVVKTELAKKADAETKIKSIENQIHSLTIKQN
jgi:valyl-tRNA synthetase